MLNDGRICFEGPPKDIQLFSDPVVRQFVNGLEKPRDTLTGMATQAQGERKLQREFARLQLHRIDFSVVMLTVENIDDISEQMGHMSGLTVIKNFAIQIQQRLDITDSCSRYSLDKILIVLHNADIDGARQFVTRLARELKVEDLLNDKTESKLTIRISAGYAQAQEDSLLKEVLAKAESKDSLYYEFEVK